MFDAATIGRLQQEMHSGSGPALLLSNYPLTCATRLYTSWSICSSLAFFLRLRPRMTSSTMLRGSPPSCTQHITSQHSTQPRSGGTS